MKRRRDRRDDARTHSRRRTSRPNRATRKKRPRSHRRAACARAPLFSWGGLSMVGARRTGLDGARPVGDTHRRGPVRTLGGARLDRRRPLRPLSSSRCSRSACAKCARSSASAISRHLHAALARCKETRRSRRGARRSPPSFFLSTRTAPTRRARTGAGQDLTREIVDGRDLIDIAERNLMAPLDAEGQSRDRCRRQARIDGHRHQPARPCRRSVRRAPGHPPAATHR